MSNCRKRKGTSQYIGVSWQKRAEKWSAQCGGFQLGLFHNEIDAAVLRDEIALEKYGEFAKLNFPDGPPPGWVRPIRQRHRKIDDVMQMIGNWDDDTITKSMIMERLGVSSGTAKRYINHLVENDDRWKKAFTEINMGRPAILAQRIEEL